MMTALSARSAEVEAQVEAYRAALLAAGMYADHPVGSVARAWLKRVGVAGWARLDLAQQCATPSPLLRPFLCHRRHARVRSAIHHSAVVSDHQSRDLARSSPGRAHAGGAGVRP